MGSHIKSDPAVICKRCGKSINEYRVELINRRPYFVCKEHTYATAT